MHFTEALPCPPFLRCNPFEFTGAEINNCFQEQKVEKLRRDKHKSEIKRILEEEREARHVREQAAKSRHVKLSVNVMSGLTTHVIVLKSEVRYLACRPMLKCSPMIGIRAL